MYRAGGYCRLIRNRSANTVGWVVVEDLSGLDVKEVIVSSLNILVRTNNRVYLSEDNGQTWDNVGEISGIEVIGVDNIIDITALLKKTFWVRDPIPLNNGNVLATVILSVNTSLSMPIAFSSPAAHNPITSGRCLWGL